MNSAREIFETLLDNNKDANKNNKNIFSGEGSFFIYIHTEMKKKDDVRNSFNLYADAIDVNSLSHHVNSTDKICSQVIDYDKKFEQLKKIIQEMIDMLNKEIIQLSGMFYSYLNRSIIQVKSSEKSALTSLLDGWTFNEMSIVADIELDALPALPCEVKKSPSLLILNRISEAKNIDDFFHSQKDMLIFTKIP